MLATADSYNFNFHAYGGRICSRAARTVEHGAFRTGAADWQALPLMALFIQSNNPAACPEQTLIRRGLAREECLRWCTTPSSAIRRAMQTSSCLPVRRSSRGYLRGYGTYYVQYGPQVIAPGRAWP